MQFIIISLFSIIVWGQEWTILNQGRLVRPNNGTILYTDEVKVIAKGNIAIEYPITQSYRGLYIVFDIQFNETVESNLMLKVNGVRRKIIQPTLSKQEISLNFLQQFKPIILEFGIQSEVNFEISNLYIFVQKCNEKNCASCIQNQDYCDRSYLNNSRAGRCPYAQLGLQCLRDCPIDSLQGFGLCTKASLTSIENVQAFLQEPRQQLVKFGESQEMMKQYGISELGDYNLRFTFKVYGNVKESVQNMIGIKLNKDQHTSFTLLPFLSTYAFWSNYITCEMEQQLPCIEIVQDVQVRIDKLEQIKFISANHTNGRRKAGSSPSYWKFEKMEVQRIEDKEYICDIQYCNKCEEHYQCSICQDGFYLYNNQCVKRCPYYSLNINNECIPDSDNQQLIIKFDDYFDTPFTFVGQQTFNSYESISIKMNNYTAYYGLGLYDNWRKQSYLNSFYLEPHYQLRFMINVTLQNTHDDIDYFYYNIDGQFTKVFHNQSYVDKIIVHTKKTLNINIGCRILSEGRCAISNYYLMVYKCSFGCSVCTGPTSNQCLEYKKDLFLFDYTKRECQDGYYLADSGCTNCSRGCNKCNSSVTCTECKDDEDGLFYCKTTQ